VTGIRTLLPVSPTGAAMPPRTAGFGKRDRFELNGKIGLHRAAGLIVLRECRQWQHNVALSASIPLQPAPFWGKFSLWRIVVAENPVFEA
jgi:hypothetical protein